MEGIYKEQKLWGDCRYDYPFICFYKTSFYLLFPISNLKNYTKFLEGPRFNYEFQIDVRRPTPLEHN